jgi:hypothetical protein
MVFPAVLALDLNFVPVADVLALMAPSLCRYRWWDEVCRSRNLERFMRCIARIAAGNEYRGDNDMQILKRSMSCNAADKVDRTWIHSSGANLKGNIVE